MRTLMKAIINGTLVFPDRMFKGNLLIDGEKIVSAGQFDIPEAAEIIDASGLYVGPGFVDQHSHGYHQCGKDVVVGQDPVAVAFEHLKHGTTTYIPSTDYSDSLDATATLIKRCKEAILRGDTPIMGIHLEGPYINKKYGADSASAVDYFDHECEELFRLAAPHALHCTYAPELPDAPKIEEKMIRYGINPAIGHCAAGPKDIERAVARGARIATHLYDAMGHYIGIEEAAKMTWHPQDCTANILLGIPGLYYELICDSLGAHVTKYCIREALRAGGEDHVVLISDATAMPHTASRTGDINYNESGTLSGSRLCLSIAARNFRRFTDADIRVTFKCVSTNSANALGLSHSVGSIHVGKYANIVLVDDDFNIRKVFFKGNEVKEVHN